MGIFAPTLASFRYGPIRAYTQWSMSGPDLFAIKTVFCASFALGHRSEPYMGELITLEERRQSRSRRMSSSGLAFYFDLRCPFSYLAAERVERTLGEVDWVPVAGEALDGGVGGAVNAGAERQALKVAGGERLEQLRLRAEHRAAELRLPLVWPDRFPAPVPGALRAAQCAAQSGAGARFALAAARLAFCGGFDLEDPEVLAEAAAAAGMTLEDCLAAVVDAALDASLRATARELAMQGLRELPAVRVGSRLFAGEQRLPEVAALLGAHAESDDWRARGAVDGTWRSPGRAARRYRAQRLSGGYPPARVG